MSTDPLAGGPPLDEQRREAFAAGQAASFQEYKAELVEAVVEAQKRGFATLMEGLEFAEKFDANDPVKARLIEAYQAGLLRLSAAIHSSRGPTAEDLESPFSGSSVGSSPSLSAGPATSPGPAPARERAALPAEDPGKRGPGRPPGVRNKPKPPGPHPGDGTATTTAPRTP